MCVRVLRWRRLVNYVFSQSGRWVFGLLGKGRGLPVSCMGGLGLPSRLWLLCGRIGSLALVSHCCSPALQLLVQGRTWSGTGLDPRVDLFPLWTVPGGGDVVLGAAVATLDCLTAVSFGQKTVAGLAALFLRADVGLVAQAMAVVADHRGGAARLDLDDLVPGAYAAGYTLALEGQKVCAVGFQRPGLNNLVVVGSEPLV
uniref:Uncharacterized protein n=1 Tax=Ixodes ricinus TaxID=34613 RepID=A0A6B0V1N1_IXORI